MPLYASKSFVKQLQAKKTANISAKKPKVQKMREMDLVAALEVRAGYTGWYSQRLNSGKIPVTNKNGRTYFVRLAKEGTPDLMIFRPNKSGGVELVFIECKIGSNKPTDIQKYRINELRKFGAKVVVCRTVEDFIERVEGYKHEPLPF